MISFHKLKIILLLIVLSIVVLIPDTVFGLLLEISHALFEVLEEGFDLLIEHVFGTGRHETQIIVFYLLFSLVMYGLYKLWRFSRRWYSELKITWAEQKTNALLYWQESSLLRKIEIVVIGIITISLLIFWHTL
ncbi:hypothetical protein [Methylobacter sp. YRD-M1]|uniref:hypothetical protein n=1 Tax=Methylobacter sp. YRD-M1 TaxID=2911520 RepID=UPI002279F67D|nr:hypothetical protein [Methylobacter sp. YRD-M1]WAK04080.1 hypothetical protein LZ558_09920 [Methylobacter sp. YRD-M1]